jgi:hypothetical protein
MNNFPKIPRTQHKVFLFGKFQNDKTKQNETNYHVIKNIPKVNKKNQYTNICFCSHVYIIN